MANRKMRNPGKCKQMTVSPSTSACPRTSRRKLCIRKDEALRGETKRQNQANPDLAEKPAVMKNKKSHVISISRDEDGSKAPQRCAGPRDKPCLACNVKISQIIRIHSIGQWDTHLHLLDSGFELAGDFRGSLPILRWL